MLIGLDAIPLTETLTGVGRYTLELSRALAAASPADEFELSYPSRYEPINLESDGEPPPPNLTAGCIPVGVLGRRWWSIGLPRYARRRGFTLFHGTNYDVPLRSGCPTVLTIHDLSAHLHAATQLPRRARRLRMRLPLMARAATMIITPTEAVRRETCELLEVDPEKVVAIHEAPRRTFRPLGRDESALSLSRLGVEGDFLLAVGTVEPRKNLIALVRAFEDLARERARATARSGGEPFPLRLVIAGKQGWLNRELLAYVSDSDARERIRFTGYVSDEELRALYSSCLAFVYPSLYEGFGLPPLEAAACGAPVVASRTPAHLETLGESAARLFAPDDHEGLARALRELLADEDARQRLALAGTRRAADFTWERAARRTLAIYAQALDGWKSAGG